MTRPPRPEVTLRVVGLFADYYREHPAWGSLHIVLDDGNLDDSSVEFCRQWAIEQRDDEGWLLAQILLGFSKGQRHKIGRLASEVVNAPFRARLREVRPAPGSAVVDVYVNGASVFRDPPPEATEGHATGVQ